MLRIVSNRLPMWRKPNVKEKRKYRHKSPNYDPYANLYPNTDHRRAYMKKYMQRRRDSAYYTDTFACNTPAIVR
jgi:hypothetical protein